MLQTDNFFFLQDVSIHASVKDATCEVLYHSAVSMVSIHASVKDATKTKYLDIPCTSFQSTRP